MTLFVVDGWFGALIFLAATALWLAGLADSIAREKYAWTWAIVALNFPAAIAWFIMRSTSDDPLPVRRRRARSSENGAQALPTHDVGTEQSRREQLLRLAEQAEDDASI